MAFPRSPRARIGTPSAIGVAAAACALAITWPSPASAAAAAATADFNGDGKADIVIGVPQAPAGTVTGAGALSIVPGSASGPTSASKTTITQDSTLGGVALPGTSETGDAFGQAAAWGDINGDGYADLAISSPGEDDTIGNTDEGNITLLNGSATGLIPDATYSAPSGQRTNGDRCGEALTVSDFNADGKADVFAFCPGSWSLWWLDGATRTVKSANPQSSSPGIDSTTSLARSEAAAGDVNHDSYTDVVLTFTQPDGTQSLIVFPGSANGIDASAAVTLDNAGGVDLATGDVNGDGTTDVVVGQPGTGTAGQVTAYYGASSGLSTSRKTTLDQESAGVPGASESGDAFGASVGVGDINKDGKADVLVGSPGEDLTTDIAHPDAGTAVTLYGASTGLTGTGSASIYPTSGGLSGAVEDSDKIGTATALADTQGDGYADIVAGSDGENAPDGTVIAIPATSAGIQLTAGNYLGPGDLAIPSGAHIGDVLAP